jgi:hypothetical protein
MTTDYVFGDQLGSCLRRESDRIGFNSATARLLSGAHERLGGVDVAADFSLDGKHALVTGSARGLGRAIAIALAHAGADVALGLCDANTVGGRGRDGRGKPRRLAHAKQEEFRQAGRNLARPSTQA